MRRRMRLPSPALVVAAAALFVALSGAATAAKVLITSAQIKNRTIQLEDLSKRARAQLTARAQRADVSATAEYATAAQVASNAYTVDGVAVSRQGLGGTLLPLASNGRFPTSAMPNIAARVLSSRDTTLPTQIPFEPIRRVEFDRVSFDTARLFDGARPTRLTAPESGVYLITATVSWQETARAGINRAVYLLVNGNVIAVDQRPPAGDTRHVVTTIYRLKSGDYVELGIAHDEPVPMTANALPDHAPALAVAWIAPG
jgi:hypothetical protein